VTPLTRIFTTAGPYCSTRVLKAGNSRAKLGVVVMAAAVAAASKLNATPVRRSQGLFTLAVTEAGFLDITNLRWDALNQVLTTSRVNLPSRLSPLSLTEVFQFLTKW